MFSKPMTLIFCAQESRKEVLDLRAQLDASRVENQVHSSKGNSLFSEVVFASVEFCFDSPRV